MSTDRPGTLERLVRKVRDRLGVSPSTEAELRDLRRHVEHLEAEHHKVVHLMGGPTVSPFLTWRPPGHFYSPIPDLAELQDRLFDRPEHDDPEIRGIDVGPERQSAFFADFGPLVDLELVHGEVEGSRYFEPNGSYDSFDASICTGVLRHLAPSRVIEIGSGYSSALMMDLRERHLPGLDLTFIEPYTETLETMIREVDRAGATSVRADAVQDVPDEVFAALEPGDVCFIDSTHVVKPGSDVVDLFARVVPALPVGTYLHVHDIFHPFEYPKAWIEEGRAWNEIYLLRAMLAGGSDFEIVFFNDWFHRFRRAELEAVDPRLGERSGGSIWLRRVRG